MAFGQFSHMLNTLFRDALTFSFHLALLLSWCSFSRWSQTLKLFKAEGWLRVEQMTSEQMTSLFDFLNVVDNWRFFWFNFRLINYKGLRTSVTCLAVSGFQWCPAYALLINELPHKMLMCCRIKLCGTIQRALTFRECRPAQPAVYLNNEWGNFSL